MAVMYAPRKTGVNGAPTVVIKHSYFWEAERVVAMARPEGLSGFSSNLRFLHS